MRVLYQLATKQRSAEENRRRPIEFCILRMAPSDKDAIRTKAQFCIGEKLRR
jgi:hypothetical protein